MNSPLSSYWQGFRDELVITCLVLVVASIGTGVVLWKRQANPAVAPPASSEAILKEMERVINQRNGGEVAGSSTDGVASTLAPTLVPTSGPVEPSVTPDPYQTQVFYGAGGQYMHEEYSLYLSSPRIEFDVRNSASRKFVVSVSLANHSISGGIQNILSAVVIKDGAVLVPKAYLSNSESKVLMPGESLDFTARLSLIEGTDISQIDYTPGGGVIPVQHVLRP
jgi:hypothetical protein